MLLLTIWPLFALICLGFALARADFPGGGFWPAAERLNYFLLFPALLVSSLAEAPLSDPAILRLGGAAVGMILLATALVAAVRRRVGWPASRFGPILQGIIRFNTYLGLALVGSLLGDDGLRRAAVVLAVSVPLVNVLSVVALTSSHGDRRLRSLAAPIARNPLILASALGVAVALLGTGLPFGADRLLELLGRASLPLGLLCVGAALRPEFARRAAAALALASAVRLVAMPALAAIVAAAFRLPPEEALVLVVFAAIPTAPTAYVLTRQLGGDGGLMAGLVTLQTVAAAATIPLVLALLG